jgi:hypothetical protein
MMPRNWMIRPAMTATIVNATTSLVVEPHEGDREAGACVMRIDPEA